ncbi:hypothetical protein [Desulfovibrio sp. UCD-KL4C]|uniref:hypothetical protein n=1 Tax=Desulfovibrio sp. UCD-KL4C TaxID=2578120 RepID=UPI0025BACD36|nr:hypothetical protein [Desulfovibrio sp. UCD-KL4C]
MDLVKDIDVPCLAEGIGLGKLTIKHPLGSCDKPVFVDDSSDTGYGAADVLSLQPIDGYNYSAEQLEYIRSHGLQIRGAYAWYMEGWPETEHVCQGH